MGMFTFFDFDLKYLFREYLVQKFKIAQIEFDTETNSNMQNSLLVFIASVLDWNYPFWASLVQKMKMISFS